jgi:hypothetical protein
MLGTTLATQEPATVDSKSLGILGLIYGAVTAGVVIVAAALVHAHVDGPLSFDGAGYQAATLSSSGLAR